jgi:uncharacterized phage protein (TIGR02218 family)
MRVLSETFAASLASGVTTLAHVWRVERRDGAVFCFTDHDRALVVDGVSCDPLAGVAGGVMDKSSGLSTDTASIAGALRSDALSEADLARGLWDGARVDVFKLDWSDPAQRVHLFAGRIGEVRRGPSAFEAEVRGLQAQLNAPAGRVFSRHCDAALGDARCAKDIDNATYRGQGVVTAILDGRAFAASGLDGFSDGWFSRGRLVWSDGVAVEVAAHRALSGSAEIELLDDPGAVLSVGAMFSIYAGCDKRFETCRGKFANAANFRGFPHMPGNDAVQAGPVAGSRLDGSSRFR